MSKVLARKSDELCHLGREVAWKKNLFDMVPQMYIFQQICMSTPGEVFGRRSRGKGNLRGFWAQG